MKKTPNEYEVLDISPQKKQYRGANKWLKAQADRLEETSKKFEQTAASIHPPVGDEKVDPQDAMALLDSLMGARVHRELANIWTFLRFLALEQIDHRWQLKLDEFLLFGFLKQWKKGKVGANLLKTRKEVRALRNELAKRKKALDWYEKFQKHKRKTGQDKMDEMFPV